MDSRCEFETTQWTAILTAVDAKAAGSQKALHKLCSRYWFPIYSYARRTGVPASQAQDLTQDFFVHLLESGLSIRKGADGGRFRSFLIRCYKNFVASARRRSSAVKRGGRFNISSIEELDAEDWELRESEQTLTPDQLYEKRWAQTLLHRVLERLEEDYALVGDPQRFRALSSCLMSAPGSGDYQEVAADLGMSVGSVRTAVHRMRVNFANLVRNEVQRLVQDPSDTEEEIRYILALLS